MRITISFLTVLVLTLALWFGDAVQGRSLRGGISLEEQHHQLDLKKQSAVMSTQEGLTKEGSVEKQPEKPDWIKGNVYTNDQMNMYSYWQLYPLKKRFKWEIPTNKRSKMTFGDAVVKNWKGYMPPHAGKVICEPMEKGSDHFRFYHRDKRGPSGYFQRAGESSGGFHQYRIWFNEVKPENMAD